MADMMAWLVIEYDVAQNFQDLHWNFRIAGATLYSVNSQATVYQGSSYVIGQYFNATYQR